MTELIHDSIGQMAKHEGSRPALRYGDQELSYINLDALVDQVASGLTALGLRRHERVGVYLPKQIETVAAIFGVSRAGGVFVPINPVLKPQQVAYILADCDIRILVTATDRLGGLQPVLDQCKNLSAVVVVPGSVNRHSTPRQVSWCELLSDGPAPPNRSIDTDMAAILYTSGSTGQPKGVVLTHRNMTVGAHSVSQYLQNVPEDRILTVLPFSFDYGLSQLTTAFHAGACAVLLNFLFPRDVIVSLAADKITGLACVPPLWVQLAELAWPEDINNHLRYVTNSGGKMPRHVTEKLRRVLPRTRIFLMYGLTEAFRSTYLPPEEIERRPDSIGRAIPNAEILVIDKNGKECPAGVEGELVHRGPLVAAGYWNDPDRTAERFKRSPVQPTGITIPEMAVWSGDIAKTDEDGYLYFVGRNDDLIKSSGYRISPAEIEEVIYASGLASECAAVGIPHPRLGHAIVVFATGPNEQSLQIDALIHYCKKTLPQFMVPAEIIEQPQLPRNPNGKIDRSALRQSILNKYEDSGP